jgi:hypothetical protein
VAALASTGASAGERERPRAPARLMVSADEWSLVLSRRSIARGLAIIQFHNRGEDPHDLRIRRIGGGRMDRPVGVSEVRPRGLVELDTRLRAGRYRLWCSLPGHRARGMRSLLSVRRR